MIDRNSEEQLDLDQIQGDILVGLQKEAELFVGFRIANAARFKRFLAGLHLTTAREALLAEDQIAAFKRDGGTGRLDIRGINIGFTRDGLEKLGVPKLGQIKDPSFKAGLAKRSLDLGDPPTGGASAASWRVGTGADGLDGMLIITGKDGTTVETMLQAVSRAAGDGAWDPFFAECGSTRPGDQHGHEHFGYLDGISQPAVRGRIDQSFPSKTFLNPGRNPADPNQGLPGADLHWPGEFVFGYQEQDKTNVEHAVGPKNGGLPWMKNGSYMVFRRLEQLVPEFHSTAMRKAHELGQASAVFEARMVGRFPSGSPISLRPDADDAALGANELKNNDFDFGDKDIKGERCPYAAHIRKAYPRNDLTPAAGGKTDKAAHDASEADTQTHRIIRRGIPFGIEVQSNEYSASKTRHSRGLMFVSYQTSIEDQFEFIIRNWVNNANFAVPGAGQDPLLGQAQGADRTHTFTGAALGTPSGTSSPAVTLEQDFIRPTGGGYFFMPSIDTVKTILAA